MKYNSTFEVIDIKGNRFFETVSNIFYIFFLLVLESTSTRGCDSQV